MSDSLLNMKEAVKMWVVCMFFGLPIAAFMVLPKWDWFYDNIVFWFLLRFTDKYNRREVWEKACKYTHLKNTWQHRAISKKYGFKEVNN
ncbi:hypothetical protein [Galbibacter sp. BG1]